jgi:DNA-binding transcriptional ArsR family regulator
VPTPPSDSADTPKPIHPRRVRAARARLLDERAATLLEQIRPILCQPTRTQIVRALASGPLTVRDLGLAVGRSQTAVSQHLRVLREEGIVSARRRGRHVYYALTSEPTTRVALRSLDIVSESAA